MREEEGCADRWTRKRYLQSLSLTPIISNNAKAFFKELILRRDPRLASIMTEFESKSSGDALFMQQIHELIGK